jgi:hypothetical protein
MDVSKYLEQVRAQYASGHATEHSYRPALHALFESIDPALKIINEPKKSEAGMPDFLIERNGIPVGWAEAKDVDKDVIKLKGYSVEQRKRYEKAYPNLIYTNGVDFEFIRESESVHFVSIADFAMGLQPKPERFEELERQLRLFAEQKPISIRSASKLAEMMAAKAAIIKDEIGIALADDPEYRSGLGGQFRSFKANLLPHLTPDEFADIYAETITYGLFAARFHDDNLSTFSRQEAMEKLPASNPFLKGLFRYIAGTDLPRRLEYIVDDLVQLMRASDPHSLFRDFGKFTARNDPFIHFYEDFLAAYNPNKRKSRGVWYTPESVVDFITRAVDDVLKAEFRLPDGLADTSMVAVDWDTGQNDRKGKPVTERREVHKVQILDPATGTGTFLSKAVQLISDRVKSRAPGKWSSYVEESLLPRLHGFELLMASYAMCHMKLDMMLTETGYRPTKKAPRLSVWLTNALEAPEREIRDLFFQPLADEALGASTVKRQTPIMCVIGNPPYSGISQNMGSWITTLIEDYKYVNGKHFGERKHWLQDDYVKFIRMAEHTIAKNPSGGVLAFISNNGYLDNPTFRGMRWHLLKTFDKIWVLDLHGNSKKREQGPEGATDKNVFDIQQGVAVIIAVRTGKSADALAEVHHGDAWGSRSDKNEFLWRETYRSACQVKVQPKAPYFMFGADQGISPKTYKNGFAVSELFVSQCTGIISARDDLAVDFSDELLIKKVTRFLDPLKNDASARLEFFGSKAGKYPPGDSRGWRLTEKRKALSSVKWHKFIRPIQYRPFDNRSIVYNQDLVDWPRMEVMGTFSDAPNIALLSPRMTADNFSPLVSGAIVSNKTASRYDQSYFFPLYNNVGNSSQSDAFVRGHRTLNLNPKLYIAVCKAAKIDPSDQSPSDQDFGRPTGEARPSELKVFDYVYGVLHSPSYRAMFAEFLKIDFPRIPYPLSAESFRHVSEKGERLRRLHLMEPGAVGETLFPYHGDGDDVVAGGYPKLMGDRVYINPDQYFDQVSEDAWAMNIGGYNPAHKWIKDRRGRALSWDDIGHYQKIIKILGETRCIMSEIDVQL